MIRECANFVQYLARDILEVFVMGDKDEDQQRTPQEQLELLLFEKMVPSVREAPA